MPSPADSHGHTNVGLPTPAGPAAIMALYHSVAEYAPLPLAMTAGDAHRLCGANPAFCQLLGIESLALLGQSLVDVVPASAAEPVRALLDRVYHTSAAARTEAPKPLHPARAQTNWVYIAWPIPNDQGRAIGLVFLIRDTSSHQHDDQALSDTRAINEQLLLTTLRERELAEQLQRHFAFTTAITTSLGEGLYTLDRAGRFTLVNPAAERMLGWAESELLGKPMEIILPMQSTQGLPVMWGKSLLQEIIHAGTSHKNVDVIMTRRDGTSFPAIYSAAPMAIDEQIIGVVVTLYDMTEVQRLRQIQEAYIALMAREHSLLEEQVRKRTSELELTNALLQAEINERKYTEQARQHLVVQLVTAQEEERSRIARELHDQMGQSVTALMFTIKVLQDQVDDASELHRFAAHLHVLGSQLGQDVRTLAIQLRPPALDDFGLLPTITTYIEQWSAQARIAADLQSTGLENIRLPQLIETTVFRIVQEALTNILRHAQASTVSVIMHRYSDTLHLIVEDDGIGFDSQAERQRPYAERRFGLIGIEERVGHLAGTLTIEATPGSGTTLFVVLPLASVKEKGQL